MGACSSLGRRVLRSFRDPDDLRTALTLREVRAGILCRCGARVCGPGRPKDPRGTWGYHLSLVGCAFGFFCLAFHRG